MKDITFNRDLLISALSKYHSKMTYEDYMYKSDIIDINNAVMTAGLPKEVIDKIWVKKRKLGEVWK